MDYTPRLYDFTDTSFGIYVFTLLWYFTRFTSSDDVMSMHYDVRSGHVFGVTHDSWLSPNGAGSTAHCSFVDLQRKWDVKGSSTYEFPLTSNGFCFFFPLNHLIFPSTLHPSNTRTCIPKKNWCWAPMWSTINFPISGKILNSIMHIARQPIRLLAI